MEGIYRVLGTLLSIIAYRKGLWKKKLPKSMRDELAAMEK